MRGCANVRSRDHARPGIYIYTHTHIHHPPCSMTMHAYGRCDNSAKMFNDRTVRRLLVRFTHTLEIMGNNYKGQPEKKSKTKQGS